MWLLVPAVFGVIAVSTIGVREAWPMFGESRTDVARVKVSLLAFEAAPAWEATHGGGCPPNVDALLQYMSSDDVNDSWGHPIRMACYQAELSHAVHVEVASSGEDGVFGTCDDITSWDPHRACR